MLQQAAEEMSVSLLHGNVCATTSFVAEDDQFHLRALKQSLVRVERLLQMCGWLHVWRRLVLLLLAVANVTSAPPLQAHRVTDLSYAPTWLPSPCVMAPTWRPLPCVLRLRQVGPTVCAVRNRVARTERCLSASTITRISIWTPCWCLPLCHALALHFFSGLLTCLLLPFRCSSTHQSRPLGGRNL